MVYLSFSHHGKIKRHSHHKCHLSTLMLNSFECFFYSVWATCKLSTNNIGWVKSTKLQKTKKGKNELTQSISNQGPHKQKIPQQKQCRKRPKLCVKLLHTICVYKLNSDPRKAKLKYANSNLGDYRLTIYVFLILFSLWFNLFHCCFNLHPQMRICFFKGKALIEGIFHWFFLREFSINI